MILGPDPQRRIGVWALGAASCMAISLIFAIRSPACAHWFLIPVTLCALVLVQDFADWLTGKMDLFDPSGLIALYGLHFFFIAPILHVHWDVWMAYVVPPADWRPWLGGMGLLNFAGLLLYKAMNRRRPVLLPPLRTSWVLDRSRFLYFCGVAALVALLAQFFVYAKFGGVLGYMRTYEAREGGFSGMGWVFIISESFSLLAFLFYLVVAGKRPRWRTWGSVALVLLVFFVLKMLFGGLRGSRSNTVSGLFWAGAVIHFWMRPLNRKLVLAALPVLIGFMYIYSFYKTYGLDALPMLRDTGGQLERSEESGHVMDKTLLGDLGRSDVQAFLLYRLADPGNDYQLRWGQTYIHWLTLMLPHFMRLDMDGKRVAGTEAQYGYSSDDFLSSRVYGLAGEAMLNFGFMSVPFALGLWGWLVARVRRLLYVLPRNDPRILLVPLLINLLINMLSSDANGWEFFIVKNAVIPFALLWLSVHRIPARAMARNPFPQTAAPGMAGRAART